MTFTADGSRVSGASDSFDDIFAAAASGGAGASGDDGACYAGKMSPDEIGPAFGLIESTLLVMPARDAVSMISRLADRLTATEMKILARTVRDAAGPGPDRETEDLADPEGKKSKKERKKKSDRAAAAKNNPELTEQLSTCLLYTSPSPRDRQKSRMPSSA